MYGKGSELSIQTPPSSRAALQLPPDQAQSVPGALITSHTNQALLSVEGSARLWTLREPMGGLRYMAGHQQVYYCVQKERLWKTQGEDHPKWKRGTGCSMVRYTNIVKTDQTVWDIIKPALLMLQPLPPETREGIGPEDSRFIERDGHHNDGITRLSIEQIDQF